MDDTPSNFSDDESSFFSEDIPWPKSEFSRRYPGIGVIGRTWCNISVQDLKVLMGDILKDSDSTVATIDINIDENAKRITLAKLHSLNDSIIALDALPQKEFEEFIKASVKTGLRNLRINIHNTGWFW